ncbi:hypothetical protein [Clavibacter sp. Sh2088]|uniref:hypothetical protein n=1 Tax=Clavibacter sp. Sh2088 TaxID=3397676 RepID=UPI0039DFE542
MIRTTRRRRLPSTALGLVLVAGAVLAGAVPAQAADVRSGNAIAPAAAAAAARNLPAPIVYFESLGKGPEPTINVNIKNAPGTSDTTRLDYEYQLDGGPWVYLSGATTDLQEVLIAAPAGEHLISFRIAGKVDGVFVAGTATKPQVTSSYGTTLAYTPQIVVDGPRVTFSWDLRKALNGLPDPVVYHAVGEDYVDAEPVDSVTFDVGYDSSVDFLLVFGTGLDNSRSFRSLTRTGSAPGTPALTSVPTPAIVGQAKLGTTLSVRTGLWQPAPVTLDYQWYSDGQQIFGETGATLVVPGYVVGTRISVEVRGTRAGYASATRMSAATPRVPSPLVVPGQVTLVGQAVVGSTLKVSSGPWRPAPVRLEHRWYRSGVEIPGATGSTYRLTEADRGKDVSVAVTGFHEPYAPGYAFTPPRRVS